MNRSSPYTVVRFLLAGLSVLALGIAPHVWNSLSSVSDPAAAAAVVPPSDQSTTPSDGRLGRGCTSAWFIDEDCDGFGVGVRSSGSYGGPGLGDRPDANDTDATINTAATVRAAYDANGNGALDTAELKSFLAAHKGITGKNVYYIGANGSNDTGKPNNPKAPYRTFHGPRGSATYGVWQYLQPGDVVMFQGGTYEEPTMGGGAPSMKSGAAGRPIVVMSMPGENVLFNTVSNYTFDTVGSHDLIIDGFNIDNPKNTGLGTGWSVSSSTNVIVRNIESQRFNYIASIDNMHNVTVEKVVIHHNTEHGLYMGARDRPSRKITIKDSIFYKNGIEAGYGHFQYNGRVTEMVIDGQHLPFQWPMGHLLEAGGQ